MRSRVLLALTPFAALLAAGPAVIPAKDESAPAGRDWPMYGGTPSRNTVNTAARGVPTDWGNKAGGKHVKWVADLGSRGYLPPAVAGGKVYVPTNNQRPRDPKVKGYKAVLMCFKEDTGAFLWQIAHDMPPDEVVTQAKPEGLLSTPAVEGDRLYYVTPAAQVVCVSTEGKVLWTCDLMKDYKVYPHYVAFGSPLVVGDLVCAVTGNGRGGGESDKPVPEPKAPSCVAVNKRDGKVVWKDNSPGENIMEGAWASPAYAVVNGRGQVIFPGGDGWLYAFGPQDGKLLWKFDCNPKGSVFRTDSRGTRSYILAPVVHDNRVYTAVGQQPDNGPGVGHLWCVDVTRAGDVSAELEKGKPNPNSGLVWHYGGAAPAGAGRDWLFGRSLGGCAVHDGLLYAAEWEGLLHCLDAKTGKQYWEEDLDANVWASPLWVDGKVYLPDDAGNVHIFEHGKAKKALRTVKMAAGVKAAAVVANGVLYVTTEKRLFAIAGK
ncbi:MAG TPA: PQQ-binding-like beta-propeller repeat protein [Gemmataceae bacterium]|nr:PQQ-binding-like beta-propeller repeat protein [Gemmataceae bacterium]